MHTSESNRCSSVKYSGPENPHFLRKSLLAGGAVTPPGEEDAMTNTPIHEPSSPATPTGSEGSLVVDCETCSERHTATCDDCVVTFLLGRRPGEAVVIDLDEHRSLRILADAGLAPPLRHAPEGR